MFLRARWEGSPPKIGEYLMAKLRPRFAYRIDEVDQRKGYSRTYGDEVYSYGAPPP